jgi:hypothetical protein
MGKAQEFQSTGVSDGVSKVSEPKTNKKNRRSWILGDFLS